MKKKVLVLGAGGMAGGMVSEYLFDFHDVVCWFRKDLDATQEVPDLTEYDYVINCIGVIKQRSNVSDEIMWTVNAEFPHKLANKCKRLIHISSDCVFSGNLEEHLSYYTDDAPDAKDLYGKSKYTGEPKNAMVLRTSIIGPAKDDYGLFEWFRNTNELVRGFSNHLWSGITTLELAKIINNIIKKDEYKEGVFQIASQKISKYDLLYLINDLYSLNKSIVRVQDKQAINRSLHSDIQAQPLDKQLVELYEIS